jgi:glycosyltransferase involved in cell wall biosynthesis
LKTIVAHNASNDFGGGEIWLSRFLAELQRRGHKVLMLCGSDDVARRAAEYGIPTEVSKLGGILVFSDAVRFALRLRRAHADIVLLTTFKKAWLGGLGATLAGVPRVFARMGLTNITPRHFLYHAAVRWWLDGIIANSTEVRDAFVRDMPQVDARRLAVIPNGVIEPRSDLPKAALRSELGLAPDTRVIGTLARLHPQKNLPRLLNAVAQLPDDVHCIIAGEGRQADALLRLAEQLNISQRVHLIGFRKDARSVLNALDVFVLSSDSEGLSTSMLQAMSVGLPVVATRVSGTADALAPGDDGLAPGLVVGFDDAELAHALRTLLDDADLRSRMGSAGRERIRTRFSMERMIDEWVRVLGL